MDLTSELENVLKQNLKDQDFESISTGVSLTIPFKSKAVELCFSGESGGSMEKLVESLREVGKKLHLGLQLHYYFIPYTYIYQLIVQVQPDDDDGDVFVVETPLKPLVTDAIYEPPKALAMAAGAGGRR